MLFGGQEKGRGWAKRGDSKRAIARACVEALEQRALLAAIAVPITNPAALVYDDGRGLLYVASNDRCIQRFDPATGTMLSPITIPDNGSSWSPRGMDLTPDGKWLYVASPGQTVWKVDLNSNAVSSQNIAQGSNWQDGIVVGADGNVLMSDSQGMAIYHINPATGDLQDPNPILSGWGSLRRSADRSTATMRYYYSASHFALIDLDAGTFLGSVGNDTWIPGGLDAINGDGSLLAFHTIVNRSSAVIAQLDAIDGGLVFDPQRDVLFGIHNASNELLAYDTSTWQEIYRRDTGVSMGWVYPGSVGYDMAMSGDGREVFFVANNQIYMMPVDLIAHPGGPYSVLGGSAITFGGTADWGPGQTNLQYEWDYNYDGQSFDVDSTQQNPTYVAPVVSSPTAQVVGLRVRAGDSQVSDIVSTTLAILPWQPTLSAGGPYQVGEGQSVQLSASVSSTDGAAISAYQWDFNYDGQTFDVDATGQTPVFSAVGFRAGSSRTIALRAVTANGAISGVFTTSISSLNAAPTATFASGGNVTMGSVGTVTFSNVRDSVADLAAGMRYNYDLNNDGIFEIRNSTSPACEVPASYLATPGKHVVRARIKDSGGLYTDYTAKIPVNVPADYYPFVPGLQWQLSGQEDGVSYTETDSIVADTYNGQSVFRSHSDKRKSGSTDLHDEYVLWNGTGFDTLGAWYPSSSADDDAYSLLLGSPIPLWSETLATGRTLTWSSVPVTFAYTDYPSTTSPLRVSGQTSGSIQFVRFEDVTLNNGLHFKNALVVQQSMTMTESFASSGVQITIDSSVTDTGWFVRGLGCIKEEESDSTRTHASNGYDKTENSTDRSEFSSLPAWANYLSFAGDVLQVNGTDGTDTISFEVSGANLTCYRNGVPQSVPLASAHGVVINALGGNDVVDASALWVPVTMAGGGGRDLLVGGHAGDVISGGVGADTILGGGGDDAIGAGGGNDSVLGQRGNDSLDGGAGNDTLDGGGGNDNLVDASGANVLLGGAGDDYIDARNGWTGDVIDGGSEADTAVTDVGEGAVNAEYCYARMPKVPGGLAAAADAGGASGVSVVWNSAKWAQSYRIERSLDGKAFELLASVPSSVLSYADSSVLDGVTYYYRICAINPIGVSAYGAGTSATVG